MSATLKTETLRARLERRGISLSFADVNTLRRAELTLTRWSEAECGDSNDFASFSIERDEQTGKPFRVIYPHTGKRRSYPIPDREAGALRRVREVCDRNGLHFYHQGDPRGCALYVSREPFEPFNYTASGVALCV